MQDSLLPLAVLSLCLLLAAIALWVRREARRAEAAHPPPGDFVEVDGVRLHYVERGSGPVVVLIHGNGARALDFAACGLIDRLAGRYRVIAFDRPGFGHSPRPRRRVWTPRAQARLLARACQALGAERPVVLGHSFGTLVALEMALDPAATVRGLVLASGYYFPTWRLDVWLAAGPAVPLLGDLLRWTVSPLLAWGAMPALLRGIFSPQPVERAFVRKVPPELMVRPAQLRAAAEDSAVMVPAAARLARRYGGICQPVEIFAGTADRVVHRQGRRQSGRLHASLPRSRLHMLPGLGHMLHYHRTDLLAASVDRLAADGQVPVLRRADVPGRQPFTRPAAA